MQGSDTEALGTQTRLLHHFGDACLTTADIRSALGMDNSQIHNAAAKLVTRGLIERVEAGCFRLTDAGRAAVEAGVMIQPGPRGKHRAVRRPPGSSQRQQAWFTMRIQRCFTIRDIVTVLSCADPDGAHDNLGRYMRQLAKAGILLEEARREEGVAPTSPGYVRYRLIRDLGPVAPFWSRVAGAMHDPNAVERGLKCKRR